MALFKATKTQVITYLLGVCPFSIAFLVFLNSSVSFVITDIINLHHGEGDAVGTLGFADELLALVACPAWGLLSDRIGVRYVCVLAYLIIALALVLFVQAKNVYPQLLLGRLLFSVGGAAASTMVTAILPAVVAGKPDADGSWNVRDDAEAQSGSADLRRGAIDRVSRAHTDSVSSDATITPATFQRQSSNTRNQQTRTSRKPDQPKSSSSRVAGFVGLFTGAGALLALAVFLPLPARFQKAGVSPSQALQDSYYIVAAVAFVLAIVVFFGFSGIGGESEKFLARLWGSKDDRKHGVTTGSEPFWIRFGQAFVLGIRQANIGLGYVGGFVARASSVGISLFIPLAINAQFRSAGLCQIETMDAPAGLPDIKRHCPRAYTLSAELTGVSQLIALLAAPLFGYLGSKLKRNVPLLFGALTGIAGYVLFGMSLRQKRQGTNGTASDFVAMALIGLSQIAAIVCSLGVLSDGILQQSDQPAKDPVLTGDSQNDTAADPEDDANNVDETTSLVKEDRPAGRDITNMKGSIAGMYSLFGGAGILVLTKVGGALFDSLSYGSPFFIMAIFNGVLLVTCILTALRTSVS